jgi:hypothetical protein
MNKVLVSLSRFLAVVLILGVSSLPVAFAGDPMAEKEAKPAMKERLTQDTVKGDLLRIEGEYYVIRDTDGKEVRLHVDHSTKLDKVMPGDKVKGYITDKGHATTLQRLER